MASDDSLNEHDFVSPGHCEACMQSWLPSGYVPEDEPPMTSEEEEETSPPVCGHPECPWNGPCYQAPKEVLPPPQPVRRPPNAVAYSVQGHLYEVALSGDATVRAVDGALVIQHHLGPVAGIVQVRPMFNEGGASGAEADQ